MDKPFQSATGNETRDYLHTVQAGAWLPFLQASLSGAVIGFCAFGLLLVLDVRHPETPAVVVGLLTWAMTWIALQRHWYLMTLETITGRDLNGDGVVGRADAPREVVVRMEQLKGNHYQQNIYHLPATFEQMNKLARGLLVYGDPIAERVWAGRGRPFSVNGFRKLRSEMLKRGLIAPASSKDSRQGFVLTEKGKAALEGFLDNPTPPPQREIRVNQGYRSHARTYARTRAREETGHERND